MYSTTLISGLSEYNNAKINSSKNKEIFKKNQNYSGQIRYFIDEFLSNCIVREHISLNK